MLRTIASSAWLQDVLCHVADFDTREQGDPYGNPVRLASGAPLTMVAADGAGGNFFLVDAPARSVADAPTGTTRPLLYADSEGSAGLLGPDLATALATLVALPNWHDHLKFSADGDLDQMRRSHERLLPMVAEDWPRLAEERAAISEALHLPLLDDPVAALWRAVTATEPDFVLLDADTGERWDSLFGPYTIDRLAGH